MYRLLVPLLCCFCWTLLLALPTTSLAQLPSENAFASQRINATERAKTLFESSQAQPRDLALARRKAAEVSFQRHMDGYRTGAPVTHAILLGVARRQLEAKLAVLDNVAGRIAAHEEYWETTRFIEEIAHGMAVIGRYGSQRYIQAHCDRLDAEMQLQAARAKSKEK
ncbi:MAG TPA: hypothetical protein VN688_15915 [Gemmataceae bacterium]|nr:hypothetical protein [Gemmataceae bacterium]